MDTKVKDRRFDVRYEPPATAAARASLRPGCAVILIEVSAGGALVEAPRALRPGGKVHLQVTTAFRQFAMSAQVLRCAVSALHPLDGVTYRGALKFDERVDWSWTAPPRNVPEA